MELRYRIPHGDVVVHAEVFFLEAGRRRIRKLLKDYKRSGPDGAQTDRLRAWLAGRKKETEEELSLLSSLIQKKRIELRSCELRCGYRRTYCDDKGKRQKAEEDLKACRAQVRALSSDLGRAKRGLEAYKKSMEDVENILGFEGGS